MPTYLFGVLPAPSEGPAVGLAGLTAGPVRSLRAGALDAWVETVDDRAVVPSIERIRAHDAVIGAALATGATPLPARFGQTFDSDDDCVAALKSQEPRLLADLARVRGCVEMRVVIALSEEDAAPVASHAETPGRAYMQALLRSRGAEARMQAIAAAVRDRVMDLVGPFVREEASTPPGAPAPVLTLSHLIARDEVASYRSTLDGALLGGEVRRFVVCGPVAPYQFVTPPA